MMNYFNIYNHWFGLFSDIHWRCASCSQSMQTASNLWFQGTFIRGESRIISERVRFDQSTVLTLCIWTDRLEQTE